MPVDSVNLTTRDYQNGLHTSGNWSYRFANIDFIHLQLYHALHEQKTHKLQNTLACFFPNKEWILTYYSSKQNFCICLLCGLNSVADGYLLKFKIHLSQDTCKILYPHIEEKLKWEANVNIVQHKCSPTYAGYE